VPTVSDTFVADVESGSSGGLDIATILIVDDRATDRKFLVAVLSHHGHRLLEAADGREALAAAHAEHPDLVITDVLMPVMDGYEFVRQLRLDSTTHEIPVVFYTAHYGTREAKALALSSGVAYVLTKPAAAQDVLKIVGESETETRSDDPPIAIAFDCEHLRLVTDKLAEKAGDLRTANARLRALINIGLELASERDAERLLQRVCVAALDLFGATYITLGILDRDDRTVQRVVTCGVETPSWINIGDTVSGILGTVVAERRPLRGDNLSGDPTALHLPRIHPEIHAFLATPIASPAHVSGWICLVGNEGQAFSEDDEQLLTALSGQVGRIYENSYFADVARAERDRAQRYLDTADVILLALDLDGRITLVNRYACVLLGWTAEDLLGRNWVDACLPARIRDDLEESRHRLLGGNLSVLEHPILARSGEERLIEWHNTVLRDEEGHVVGTLSSGSDVTERRQAEAELSRVQDEIQHQRLQVFKATMRTVQDIVGNALMSLYMFRTDVEPFASQDALAVFDDTIRDTSAKLKALGDLDKVVETQMEMGAGIEFPRSATRE
jgi:PAS domain S-box-containing protein